MMKFVRPASYGYFGANGMGVLSLHTVSGVASRDLIEKLIDWRETELKQYERGLIFGKLEDVEFPEERIRWFEAVAPRIISLATDIKRAKENPRSFIGEKQQTYLNSLLNPRNEEEDLALEARALKLAYYELNLAYGQTVHTLEELDAANPTMYDEAKAAKLELKSKIRKIPVYMLKVLPIIEKVIHGYKYDPDYLSKEGLSETTIAFSALVDDIREHGVKQPLIVNSDYEILSGNKRYRALKELNLTSEPIDVIVSDTVETSDGTDRGQSKLEIFATSNIKIKVTYWETYDIIKNELDNISLTSGFRSDLKSQEGSRHNSRQLVGKMMGLSKSFVDRIIVVGDTYLTYFKNSPHVDFLTQLEDPDSKMTLTKAEKECRYFLSYVEKRDEENISEEKFNSVYEAVLQKGHQPSQFSSYMDENDQRVLDFVQTEESFCIWARNVRDIGDGFYEINFEDIIFTNPNDGQ